jgi:leucyl-tRNA synthetase
MKRTGHMNIEEPFSSLFTQGMVIHETFKTAAGEWVFPADAVRQGDAWIHAKTGEPLTIGGVEKMSKSKKNVVDPDTIVEHYGADTARWFMLSDTPPERDIEWTEAGVEGAWRFTQRLWRLINDAAEAGRDGGAGESAAALALRRVLHRNLAALTSDLEGLRFNRAIARIYEMSNALTEALRGTDRSPAMRAAFAEAARLMTIVAAPMMPHLAEEIWAGLGGSGLCCRAPWPKADPALLAEDEVTIAVQVNGKRRDEITIAKGMTAKDVEALVLNLESVARSLEGRPAKKVIVVQDRIANIVG